MTHVPVFYINLASRPDRRAFMEAQFARLKLGAVRVEAINSASVPAEYLRRYSDSRRTNWLTPGEIACGLSHMEAMERIVHSGAAWGCILEDDVELSASLPEFLEAVAATPPAADLLRIEAVYRAIPMRRVPGQDIAAFGIYRCYGTLTGTAGYLVSARAAKAITTGKALLGRAADDAMFNAFQPLSRRLHVRLLGPALCTQIEAQSDGISASDIGRERGGRDATETRHFWHNFWRKLVLIADRDIRQGSQKTWHQLCGAKKLRLEFKLD